MNKLRKGFTLAELMAVIVIIGILAGIALGSYQKAIERSRFSEGLSGAHALAAGADTYYYDNQFNAPTKMSQFGVSLANPTHTTDLSIETKNFKYTYDKTNKFITAKRLDSASEYTIKVYTEMAGGVHPDECNGNADFCKSMGYTSCSGTICKKP